MPTAPPAADLFSLKKSCKIEQEVVIFVGYSEHSGKNDILLSKISGSSGFCKGPWSKY